MNLFQEIIQRRVLQITGGYLAAAVTVFGLVDIFEGRMWVSPNMVALVGLTLILLLPTVATLAWSHGRPGPDSWGRIPKVVLPANLLAVALLLVFQFHDKELGPVMQTIEVEDDNGVVSERMIPKQEFRHRVYLFYPENTGAAGDDWARETLAVLVALDVNQDIFVSARTPMSLEVELEAIGSDDGHGLTRPLQRKIARDSHIPHFMTGTINHRDDVWTYTTELHDTESGRRVAEHTFESSDLFALADLVSRQLREDFEIPSFHLENSQDLPVADMTSSDLEAVRSYVLGKVATKHHNDWASAVALFERAVERDPRFALAHYRLFMVYRQLGRLEEASAAIAATMENMHQLPERDGFGIKTTYYYAEKQDPDKGFEIVQRWNKIYPSDLDALSTMALLYEIRQDLPNALATNRQIFEIDPSRVDLLTKIASLHFQLGNYDEAESGYRRYIEIFPAKAEGYKNLAGLYSALGRLEEARASLEEALLFDPGDLDLALNLVDLNIKFGRYAESRALLATKLDGAKRAADRFGIIARQMQLAYFMGQTNALIEKTELIYTPMSEIMPPMDCNVTYTVMLMSFFGSNRPQEALRRVDEFSATLIPQQARAVSFVRAIFLTELGRTEEAKTALARAAEYIDRNRNEMIRPLLSFVEGYIAETTGDFETAAAQYRSSVETGLLQHDPDSHVQLARVLRLQGKYGEALERLTMVFSLFPASPKAHLEMAYILNERGEFSRAREHLQTAQAAWLEAEADYPFAKEARELAAAIQ